MGSSESVLGPPPQTTCRLRAGGMYYLAWYPCGPAHVWAHNRHCKDKGRLLKRKPGVSTHKQDASMSHRFLEVLLPQLLPLPSGSQVKRQVEPFQTVRKTEKHTPKVSTPGGHALASLQLAGSQGSQRAARTPSGSLLQPRGPGLGLADPPHSAEAQPPASSLRCAALLQRPAPGSCLGHPHPA